MEALSSLPKKRLQIGQDFLLLKEKLAGSELSTICQEARCPNIYECFSQRRCSFLILGKVCTRGCRFCSLARGKPEQVDAEEPFRIASIVSEFRIRYVVVTSVTRDDLEDCGAGQFVEVINCLRKLRHQPKIEVLIPDFGNRKELISKVVSAGPDCIAHNIETVRRLSQVLKGKRSYEISLSVLSTIRKLAPEMLLKSSILLGLGEEREEVKETILELKRAGCNLLVLGQYLKPSPSSWEVQRIIGDEEFECYREFALGLGFRYVFAGTWMRSSNAIFC